MLSFDFSVSSEVLALGARVAGLLVDNLNNAVPNPGVEAYRSHITEALKSQLSREFIKLDPVLSGFRNLHNKIGRSNRRFPAASEALVDLFVSKGIVPVINPVVDIYNLVSLETRLSLGAHDTEKIHGNITLRFTNGSERFIPLGAAAPVQVNAGEYCYIDDSNEILCRLEHKQVEKTKITGETRSVFFIIQGNTETSRELLERSCKQLADLLKEHCGGMVQRAWIYT